MKKIITTISVICVISGLAFSQWLNVEESSITLAPGESITVNVTANGSELLPGNYELPLTITTNDPQLEMVQLPATATIYTKPKIAVVTDVPNDQGGAVFVEFYRCFYDDTPLNADRTPELYTVEMNEGNGWIAVQSLSAYGENSYTALVPTTIDSSATGDGLLNFRVIAAMEEGNWVSDIVQGYSVDNIVPEAPQNLLATTSHQKVNLTWDYPIADDYQYTEIYRNDELVGTTITDSFTDETVTPNTEYEYSVRHLDANNNAGENTILTTRTLSWSIAIDGVMGEINTEFVLGVSEDGSTGFDDGNDIPQPPNPPTDFVNIFTHHPEWEFVLGDKFIQDVMGDIDLADTMQVWEVHLFSDNDGDVVVDFDFSDEVPELPAFIYDEELTYKLPLTDEMTHIFTLSANTESVFYLAIGDNTPPVNAVTYPNGLEILRSGEEASFTFDATDGYTYENMISMSYDGIEYEEIGLTTDNFIAFTPEHILSNSCYIKVVTTDFAGNFIEDVSDYEFTVVGGELTHTAETGWILGGSPLSFENTIAEQLSDDTESLFYTYLWENGGYAPVETFEEGYGIWLGFVDNFDFDISGEPYTEPQSIEYPQGWSIISNPLVRDIDITMLSFTVVDETMSYGDAILNGWITEPVYGYDMSDYYPAETLELWSAYWLGVLVEGLTVNYTPHEAQDIREISVREYDWQLTLNNLTIAGEETSSANWDIQDYPLAPIPPASDYIDVAITHPEWEFVLGDRFMSDIRPITTWDEIQEYTLTFTGSGDLPLTWVYENIPETEDIIFTYGDTDYNLRELDELTISIDGYGVGLLRIGQVLSSTEFHIPTEYALNSAYPNPFNPTTTIGYSVPAPSSLLLAIYNINGQLVETLVNTQMEAGYHTIEWDADNQPSGLYFVRMVAGNFVSTQKVLLLK